MKIAIVILNYNGIKNTLECIESLRACDKKNIDLEIIVVDNNSSDNSKELLRKHKSVSLIENHLNLGYSGGMNSGVRKALQDKADYILLLNNDIVADTKFLANMVKKAKKDTILSPKIYFAKNFEFHKNRYHKKDLGRVIWYAGGKIDWKNVLGVHIGVDEIDKRQFSKFHSTDFATGAAIFIPRQVFEKIGLLNENYFLYFEDIDFCIRAKEAGFKIMFEPSAIIWHKNAATTGGSGSHLQDYFISRNRLLFAFKYAKLKTKLAVVKQTLLQINNPNKRKALLDFFLMRFKQGSYKL